MCPLRLSSALTLFYWSVLINGYAQEETLQLGDIQICPDARTITIPAKVNQAEGLIEFILVHSSGKVHEALLSTTVTPVELAAAFTLLGVEGKSKNLEHPLSLPSSLKEFPELEIKVSNNDSNWHPVTQWIHYKGEDAQSLSAFAWRYCGSYFYRGNFMAQVEGDLVGIYTSVNALINYDHPDRADDTLWFAQSPLPRGSAITIKFSL